MLRTIYFEFQLALTHPSYRVNFGTNPDHARNSLSNCGFRQPEYGDRRIHHVHNRKRGKNNTRISSLLSYCSMVQVVKCMNMNSQNHMI